MFCFLRLTSLFTNISLQETIDIAINLNEILVAFENDQDSLNVLDLLNNMHPNIKFTIKKQLNHSFASVDVFISGINNQNLTLQRYHKSTYTKLYIIFI